MLVFLGATLMVVLAEMGDKTQLLAMAMATRFRASTVLWGVFIATVINNGLAVAVGTYLRSSINMELIQILASASFILFGLWIIRGDRLEDSEKRGLALGPVLTVATAFFVAEMGDKTQLAAVALAAKYHAPLATLLGATAGMLIADAIGIYAGVVAGKRLPDRLMKWLSALLFILFGFIGLYTSVPREFVTWPNGIGLTAITLLALLWIQRRRA